MCICLFFCCMISQNDAARINKLGIEMSVETHICCDQKVKVTSHKDIASVGLCILVSAGLLAVFIDHCCSRTKFWS